MNDSTLDSTPGNWWQRLTGGLKRSSSALGGAISDLVAKRKLDEATIVEMSWYGSQMVSLPLGQAFHARRLTIKSSQVGSIASPQRARWDFRRRMAFALASLADPALDVLITGESAFESLPKVMADLADGTLDALCHRVRYEP